MVFYFQSMQFCKEQFETASKCEFYFFSSALHFLKIGCKKTKLKTSSLKNLRSNWCFFAFQPLMTFRPKITFWPEMALWPEMASWPKILMPYLKWLFSQKWLVWPEIAFWDNSSFDNRIYHNNYTVKSFLLRANL